jgi:hypothetical protein
MRPIEPDFDGASIRTCRTSLSRACGDSFDEPVEEAGGYSEIQVFPSIAYDCAIDIDRAVLQAAAAALIENEAIASDLRLQIVDFDALIAMVQGQKDFVENGLAVWLDQAGD